MSNVVMWWATTEYLELLPLILTPKRRYEIVRVAWMLEWPSAIDRICSVRSAARSSLHLDTHTHAHHALVAPMGAREWALVFICTVKKVVYVILGTSLCQTNRAWGISHRFEDAYGRFAFRLLLTQQHFCTHSMAVFMLHRHCAVRVERLCPPFG